MRKRIQEESGRVHFGYMSKFIRNPAATKVVRKGLSYLFWAPARRKLIPEGCGRENVDCMSGYLSNPGATRAPGSDALFALGCSCGGFSLALRQFRGLLTESGPGGVVSGAEEEGLPP